MPVSRAEAQAPPLLQVLMLMLSMMACMMVCRCRRGTSMVNNMDAWSACVLAKALRACPQSGRCGVSVWPCARH